MAIKEFASLAILQLCLGETEADWLADKTGGGAVAICDHPTSRPLRAATRKCKTLSVSEILHLHQQVDDHHCLQTKSRDGDYCREHQALDTGGEFRWRCRRSFVGGVLCRRDIADDDQFGMNPPPPWQRLTARLHLPTKVTSGDADRIAALLELSGGGGWLAVYPLWVMVLG